MRISIWPQFSSNHSSTFHIVGYFGNSDKAQEAGQRLREMLKNIEEARIAQNIDRYAETPPTAVEMTYSQEFNIAAWGNSLDWIVLNGDVVRNFGSYGPFVFVGSEPSTTWQKGEVIKPILEQLGAHVSIIGEDSDEFRVKLRCTAPNETIAAELHLRMGDYLEQKSPLNPWIDFWNGRKLDNSEESRFALSSLQSIDTARTKARTIYEARNGVSRRELIRSRYAAQHKKDDAEVQRLTGEIERIEANLDEITPRLTKEQSRELDHAVAELDAEGNVSQDGLELEINLRSMFSIEQVVPAMMAYLKAKGCVKARCIIDYHMY